MCIRRPQQIVPQDEAEQPVQCPEGLVFIPGAGCRQPPIDPGGETGEDEEQPIQCPEGTVFSIKAGECVSEGPQQIVPQEDAEQPVQCPEGTVFVPGGGCRLETVD